MFRKGQYVTILNILYVQRRLFRTVSAETVPRYSAKRVCWKKIWYEWNFPPVELDFSVYPISGGQHRFPEPGKQLFYENKNEEQHH